MNNEALDVINLEETEKSNYDDEFENFFFERLTRTKNDSICWSINLFLQILEQKIKYVSKFKNEWKDCRTIDVWTKKKVK